MPQRDLPPIHPGEQLREEFMKPLSRIQDLVAERRTVTGDTALRLARYFGTTLNLG